MLQTEILVLSWNNPFHNVRSALCNPVFLSTDLLHKRGT